MKYFPSPVHVMSQLDLTDTAEKPMPFERKFTMQYLSDLIMEVGIDETRYVDTHPDLGPAIEAGAITSGQSHFAKHGYFESRRALPANFDPEWYTKEYSDVARFLENTPTATPEDHFMQSGHREWRLPCADAESGMLFWRALLS